MTDSKKTPQPPPHVAGADAKRSAVLALFPDSTEVVLLTDPELGEVTDIDMTIGMLNVILARCYEFERMRDEKRDAVRTAEQERLRFEGDLDKWMKTIGAGITGSQPEAYAMMDHACGELVRARATIEMLRASLKPFSDFAGAVFSRNINSHDDIMELDPGDGDLVALSAGHFFEARQAFASSYTMEASDNRNASAEVEG